jgi:hypothetical protein
MRTQSAIASFFVALTEALFIVWIIGNVGASWAVSPSAVPICAVNILGALGIRWIAKTA